MTILKKKTAILGVSNEWGTQNSETATQRCSAEIALGRKISFKLKLFCKSGQNPWKTYLKDFFLVSF